MIRFESATRHLQTSVFANDAHEEAAIPERGEFIGELIRMAYTTTVTRHKTREVGVGHHVVGGSNPIWVQSMTTTDTFNVAATLEQIHRLEEAGCEIIRVTVPKKEDAAAVGEIRSRIKIPLIADIHFDYRMALACMDAKTPDGKRAVDKIRINPGNIGGRKRYEEVIRKAKDTGTPVRIGVNSGSLEEDLIEKYGFPCPEAMVESALRHIEIAEALGFYDMIISLKASHVPTALECYTLFAQKSDYPTHVGITEAGSREYGTIKSAAGIGAILLRGVGDTIRVSLLGDPVPEVAAGFDILRACDRRITRPEVVACPTCGRLDIDLERIVAEVEEKMKKLSNPLRISILGCLVNGFGEAKEADLGIAAGSGKGVIFKRGVPIRNVIEADMVQALWEEVQRFEEDTPPLESYTAKQKAKEAKAASLTVIN